MTAGVGGKARYPETVSTFVSGGSAGEVPGDETDVFGPSPPAEASSDDVQAEAASEAGRR